MSPRPVEASALVSGQGCVSVSWDHYSPLWVCDTCALDSVARCGVLMRWSHSRTRGHGSLQLSALIDCLAPAWLLVVVSRCEGGCLMTLDTINIHNIITSSPLPGHWTHWPPSSQHNTCTSNANNQHFSCKLNVKCKRDVHLCIYSINLINSTSFIYRWN